MVAVGVAEAAVYVVDSRESPHAVWRPVGLDEVRWTEGFWGQRVRTNREHSIPAMWRLMRDSRYKPFYEHFLIAAGKREGDYHGAAWNDGDFYKWIEAACSTLATSDDPALRQAVDEAVAAVVAAQRSDGYLHTPVLIAQRNGDPGAQPFSDRHDFEVYNLGHLMTAGVMHHRVTGERSLLDAAIRAAGFLDRAFANPSPTMARQAVCPSHYMGLVELHRATGDAQWLRLAQRVLNLRGVAAGVDGGGGDDNQDRIPFLQQREAVGHAVRANYLYAGAADVYMETGDPRLVAPLEAVWRNVWEKKLYVTGACGALYDGASPDGSPDQSQITRVHQAYGRNYQLPNVTAHNETCAAVGAVLWNWRRFAATGDASALDWIELSMQNAVLAGVSLDGERYFYTNPLRVSADPPAPLRWSRAREEFIVSYCCPPNVARTLAQLSAYAYSVGDDRVSVNLYGASELDTSVAGQRFRLRQETAYPWDGEVRITIEEAPKEPVTLAFRKPFWARDGVRLQLPARVSAADVDATEDSRTTVDGFLSARAVWSPGDTLTLTLPMPIELLEAHPLVEETRNQIAVRRGPVVYCLESCDLPADVGVDDVWLRPDGEFRAVHDPSTLEGVTVIEATLGVGSQREWEGLYRPLQQAPEREVAVRLVPYFAWGNRGPSEMTVWLPRR